MVESPLHYQFLIALDNFSVSLFIYYNLSSKSERIKKQVLITHRNSSSRDSCCDRRRRGFASGIVLVKTRRIWQTPSSVVESISNGCRWFWWVPRNSQKQARPHLCCRGSKSLSFSLFMHIYVWLTDYRFLFCLVKVNQWSWGCVGLGFGVEGACCHGFLGSEKLWELFVSRESWGNWKRFLIYYYNFFFWGNKNYFIIVNSSFIILLVYFFFFLRRIISGIWWNENVN